MRRIRFQKLNLGNFASYISQNCSFVVDGGVCMWGSCPGGGRHSSPTPRDLGGSLSDYSNTFAGPGKVRLKLSFVTSGTSRVVFSRHIFNLLIRLSVCRTLRRSSSQQNKTKQNKTTRKIPPSQCGTRLCGHGALRPHKTRNPTYERFDS